MTKETRLTILKKAQALYYDLRNRGLTHQVAFRAVVDLLLSDWDWRHEARIGTLEAVNDRVMQEEIVSKKKRSRKAR